MRYKAAAIVCFGLIVGMFGLPAAILAIFLPSLKQGLPNPIPGYERVLLEIASFCSRWKWLVALPATGLGLVFTIAEFTRTSRGRR
jgi:type II secretory pathway component PulF